jgi:D-aspartate ligase
VSVKDSSIEVTDRLPQSVAVVLGEIDLVTALGRAGIPCAVSAVPGDPALFSRHVRWVLPWADPRGDPEAMTAALEAFARTQARPPSLYYNGDADLVYASRNRAVLGRSFRFVLPEADLVESLVDKLRWQELAEQLGFPVPRAAVVGSDGPPPSESLSWPLVTKPARGRHTAWRSRFGPRKAILVKTGDELEDVRRRLPGEPLIVQEFVPGPESEVHSYHVYVDDGDEVVAEFTGRKIRTFPPQFGETTALSVGLDSGIAAMGRDMVAALKLRGVAKFDYKRAPNGQWFLLEVNPRFTLWHNAGASAGVNIPALVHADLNGAGRPRHSLTGTAQWCHPTADFRAARATGLSISKWLRWATTCDARWALTWRDPMPFVRGVVGKKLRRMLTTPRRTEGRP